MKDIIILDLDETLITTCYTGYCECNKESTNYFIIDNTIVHIRKDLEEFLERVFTYYRVAIWTASTESHCIPILKEILKQRYNLLEFIIYRTFDNYAIRKDLNYIENKFGRIVLIDDQLSSKVLDCNSRMYVNIKKFDGKYENKDHLISALNCIEQKLKLRKYSNVANEKFDKLTIAWTKIE